ncbi:type II secretion system protein GspL [Hydrogenophaga electricum]|uniref:GspL cytoplasmic actin-ATPase-like domain-containing protein n=1 Tax=Hydrogenophaga electricum TaxID=1230953 RepID=A0ABQ6C612_9BURK|nr:type II secretion system protein GspL [Hydrogenophaga electricum]GLS15776.1 hypothetical protein GCM10007935_32130 [Hydrogenophaga electricum]
MLILTPSLSQPPLAPGVPEAWDWVTSTDGREPLRHGSGPLASVPDDPDVVLCLPPRRVAWHRVVWPKVPAGKWRAALEGLLEERLLDDVADTHLALPAERRPGQPLWVAACHAPWLRSCLQVLEAANRPAGRIVPLMAPGAGPEGVEHWVHLEHGQPWVGTRSADGVLLLPLHGTEPGAHPRETADVWLAEPAAAPAAEQRLGHAVALRTLAQQQLQATQSDWNLAQMGFSLSKGARQQQRLRAAWRAWRSHPAWRPARWGLAALLVIHIAGLNALAWQERQRQRDQQQQLDAAVREAAPGVTLVIDGPAQLRREVQRLQRAGGLLGEGDLETLLNAIDPGEAAQLPVPRSIEFANGRTTLTEWNGDAAALEARRAALAAQGWQTRLDGPALVLQPDTPATP